MTPLYPLPGELYFSQTNLLTYLFTKDRKDYYVWVHPEPYPSAAIIQILSANCYSTCNLRLMPVYRHGAYWRTIAAAVAKATELGAITKTMADSILSGQQS
jgi:hypothetical protein